MDKSMLDKNNGNEKTEVEEIKVGPDVDIEVEPGVVIEGHTQRVVISKDITNDNIEQPAHEQSTGKIDLNKVHEMETKATDAIEKGIGAVMGAVQGAFDSVTNGLNNTVDKVENNGGNQQYNQYNQYGQQVNQGQQNYNQYTQPNQTQYKQGNYQGQDMNQNKNTFQQGFVAQPNRADNITSDKLKLEPTLAALVSFFVSGLGQMINGQLEKGLIILGCGVIIIPILAVITCGLGALLAIPFAIFQIIDAYKCAQILQSGRPLGKFEYHLW